MIISKFIHSIKNSRGLTLVELLVAIGVIIAAATVVVAIITTSFRTSTRIGVSEDIRQSGNNALTQVTKMIQFSKGLNGVVTTSNISLDSCTATKTVYKKIMIQVGTEEKVISCTNPSDGTTSLNLDGVPFIDESKVIIDTCKLTCTQTSPNETPLIGVELDLSQSGNSTSENTSINLSKTIKIRNLSSD